MNKVLVVGSINIDFVVNTPRVPRAGETISGTDFQLLPGGKGANQAVAARRLGAETQMIGCVGDDIFGNLAMATLKDEKIKSDNINIINRQPTGTAVIMVEENGENRIVIVPGANAEVKIEKLPHIEQAIKQADFLVLQFEIPLETTLQLIKLAHQSGTKVVLNPAPAYHFDPTYFELIDYFIVNETETEFFVDLPVKDIPSADKAAEKLLSLGVKNAIITLGAQGVVVKNKHTHFHRSGIKVDVVDTTAAGDTFVGALVAALESQNNLKQAINFAVYASALTVTKLGAQPSIPTKAQTEAFIGTQQI